MKTPLSTYPLNSVLYKWRILFRISLLSRDAAQPMAWPLVVTELTKVTLGRVPYVDPLVGEVHGHVLLEHSKLGRLDLGHVLSPIAAPDTVLAGIASPRLAHPQLLGLEKISDSLYPTTGQGLRFLVHLGVVAGFVGGVGS